MLNPYNALLRARRDYHSSLNAGLVRRIINSIRHRRNTLLTYEDVAKNLHITGRHDAGIQVVALDSIVGTVGRTHDFDSEFHPLRESSYDRWCSVARALHKGKVLPPVELYKIRDAYFVIDGNHRVSVMRHNGQQYLEAHVIEIDTPDCFDFDSGDLCAWYCEN